MKLWLISQEVNTDWDTYDSAVVVAETEEEARQIHPDGHMDHRISQFSKTWAAPNQVTATLIGDARSNLGLRVVCASFNAG